MPAGWLKVKHILIGRKDNNDTQQINLQGILARAS